VTTSEPVNMNPPPPPPPKEEPDAGADSGAQAGQGGGVKGAGASTACSKCGEGQSSAALQSALSSAAQSAQGCYNRAIQRSAVSGRLSVSVQVGQNGAVCGAAITNDSVHSGDISSCVLGRFRGRTFPAPQSGCVVVNIPINFTIKE
jgi:hypothetical protein